MLIQTSKFKFSFQGLPITDHMLLSNINGA
jgi:hypothetical protein